MTTDGSFNSLTYKPIIIIMDISFGEALPSANNDLTNTLIPIQLNEFKREQVVVDPEIKSDISGIGSFCLRPFRYGSSDNSNELIIKGCEMLSRHGIVKLYRYENGVKTPDSKRAFISGVIPLNEPQRDAERAFVSVIDDIVNISQTLYDDVESPIIVRPKTNTRNILFSIVVKKGEWPNFYDTNGNVLSWKQLRKTSLRFIPTFKVRDIYMSNYRKKIRVQLVEATVTEFILRDKTDISDDSTSEDDLLASSPGNVASDSNTSRETSERSGETPPFSSTLCVLF